MNLMKTMLKSLLFCLLLSSAAEAAEDFAQQVLAETNLARTKPHQYAENLRKLRRMYEGKGYWEPGSGAMVITNEGVTAVDEAIAFLGKQAPVSSLTWSPGLAQAAEDLVRDEGRSGEIGHKGSSSGDMKERIDKHGTWSKRIGENIAYGPSTPRMMVMELIIDDGVSGRGHRKNIFASSYSVAGVACGPHSRYRNMCVIDFAGGYHSKEKK
jgi:hypothetical protein